MKPKLLELFSGAGGAGMGYHRAGFDVVGVDIKPQPNYPFRFVQADALDYAAAHGWEFDAIHASPPCQAHSHITPDKSKHVDLIPHTRWMLESLGKPYVIENVPGAQKALREPIMLCGAQFGLKVYRHRFFESNVFLMSLPHYPHKDQTPPAGHGVGPKGFVSVTSGGLGVASSDLARFVSPKGFISVSGHFSQSQYVRFAMGIEWMTSKELSQAIPPAYTEFIGRQLILYIKPQAAPPAALPFAHNF